MILYNHEIHEIAKNIVNNLYEIDEDPKIPFEKVQKILEDVKFLFKEKFSPETLNQDEIVGIIKKI